MHQLRFLLIWTLIANVQMVGIFKIFIELKASGKTSYIRMARTTSRPYRQKSDDRRVPRNRRDRRCDFGVPL
jgi:hypothetical protein